MICCGNIFFLFKTNLFPQKSHFFIRSISTSNLKINISNIYVSFRERSSYYINYNPKIFTNITIKMITSIKPMNLVLFNTYTVLLVFLSLNWQNSSCEISSNIWELFYYIILYSRLLIHEL